MMRFIWSHLLRNRGRSAALLAGVLVATTGFTVLTGTTATSRLAVTGTVDANARAAYDILVRPKGARTPLEVDRGLVRPNYLSGIFGGLTMAQYDQVKAVAGVDVAAPIAMIGYANGAYGSRFDITDLVDRGADRQLLRFVPTFQADRGTSRATGRAGYVYVVKDDVSWPDWTKSSSTQDLTFTGGEHIARDQLCDGFILALVHGVPICESDFSSELATDRQVGALRVVRLRPDGKFEGEPAGPSPVGEAADRLVVSMATHLPFLLAAVDPDAEQRLVGLGGAVNGGRYLTAADAMTRTQSGSQIPVLSSSSNYIDSTTTMSFAALPAGTAVAGVGRQDLAGKLDAQPGRPLGERTDDGERSYRDALTGAIEFGGGPETQHLVQTGPTQYTVDPDGTLVAQTVPADPEAYRTESLRGLVVPWQIDDTAFRTLTKIEASSRELRGTKIVGTYDPDRLAGFSELSKVPMETYEAPGVTGGDRRTSDLLGGRPLVPDGNAAGYLASPPLLLTNLALVPDLLAGHPGAKAPISAIRVRVAGVQGYTKESRERVRVVAEQIAVQTGLDVDITYGASASPQAVRLAAGVYGRPVLVVKEPWVKKGVATIVVNAVDRKSAVLFVLVLVVCALFLANAVSAAVQHRRRELAVLACMGWSRARIGTAVLAEVLLLGAVAGVLSLGLAAALGGLLGVHLAWTQALLALPAALGLSLVAGAGPALRASRAHPAAALHPPVARALRARRPRGVIALGLVNLGRVPGRTLLGALSLAIGIAGLTLLAAVTFAFHGAIIGTVLGDAISVQVRGVDAIAVVATVLLGAFAVADVLYINIRNRGAEFATLRATGWTDGALTRLVLAEGAGMGVLGGVLGAGLGLGGAALLVGDLTGPLVTTSAVAAVAGVVLAGVAALVPALAMRRHAPARLLTEE